ncbi:hypothetical protein [Noviherbaspirillum sedimenti]|uniref:hypothetical protein n=1 Tax=Noviherbaspirillum sedimenti TaxID=2320865 RepID=UPI001F358F27|nr:hypothetical protein [Noviherbaspirillum sedimenti]
MVLSVLCEDDQTAGRAEAKSVIVPAFGHSTFHDAQARQEVTQFVRRLLDNP